MRAPSLFSLFLVALGLPVVSSVAPSDLTLRQSVTPPHGWTHIGRAPDAHIIQLRIALPQPRFPELEQHLMEISDPSHVRYGKHLSKEEVEALVAPHSSSVEAVHVWLAGHGIQRKDCRKSPASDWIMVHVPVSQAEKMLSTEFRKWKNDKDGDVLVRTTEYSLPAHLDEHIELVQPTTAFHRTMRLYAPYHLTLGHDVPSPLPADAKIAIPGTDVIVNASCNATITVSCLKQLYNVASYAPRATKKNAIALTGYLEQYPNFADLRDFYADQVPAAVNTSFDVVLINGGLNNQSQAGVEANLDVQFALGISFPTPGTFYSTGRRPRFNPDKDTPTNTDEPYMEWLDFVLSQKEIPQTISTSYGDHEQTVPVDLARRVCVGFAQLGARGISLLFSSGDAETLTLSSGTAHIPEVAANFSEGGFSEIFPRPQYQDTAVTKFLKSLPNSTYAGLFNPDGRAFPDVSAQAEKFRIFFRGQPIQVGGTSASSPTFAALVALLNDARIAAGKPPLGFLNPLIYKLNGKGFNDITVGNAPGCGTLGFNATVGWDPVTGFGTPNFDMLRELVLEPNY